MRCVAVWNATPFGLAICWMRNFRHGLEAHDTRLLFLLRLQDWRCPMFIKTHIRKHERGLHFRKGDFVGLIGPGTVPLPIWNWERDRIVVVDTLKTRLEHPLLDVL